MIITKITQKIKCDFSGCKNLAEIMISHENDFKKKMCFCESCIKSIYEGYSKSTTPKPVEAPFKKQKKLR